jgi:hypothetical protein
VAPLDGVVRLVARYEAFGRPAAMVFHYRHYLRLPPTSDDCRDLAEQYGLWEDNGGGLGYTLLRSTNSLFTVADSWSIDPRSNAVFSDTPFRRPGQLPDIGSFMLPADMAPVIRWRVAPRSRLHGRTYCVGVASSTFGVPSDRMTVPLVVADDLVTQFRRLIPPPFPLSNYGMVSLSRARRLAYPQLQVVLDITDASMPTHRMGSQRRRGRDRSQPLLV